MSVMSPLKDPEARRAAARRRYAEDPDYKAKLKRHSLNYERKKIADHKVRVSEIKATTPCADCHTTFDPICMDFDHLGESKKAGNISTMVSKGVSWRLLLAEMSKCELVCSNCHRLRSQVRDVRVKPTPSTPAEKRTAARIALTWNLVTKAKSVPCTDCHATPNPVCMDFDHMVEGEKLHNISRLASRASNVATVEAEIAKCEVVCSNCHRLRTKDRRKPTPPQLGPTRMPDGTRRQKSANTSSRFKGVSHDSDNPNKPWAVYIYHSNKKHRLGRFTTQEEAARRYDAAVRELFGDSGTGRYNFPNPGELSI